MKKLFKKPMCEALELFEKKESFLQTFSIKPLERGFGNTLGNALRRTMLSSSSKPNVVPFAVKINNVHHEFETLENVTEDIVEIILNVRKIIFKSELSLDLDEDKTFVCRIKDKNGKITVGDIEDLGAELSIDKGYHDLTIVTAGEDKNFNMEIFLRVGRGFVSFQENKEYIKKLDDNGLMPESYINDASLIAIDSDFSSILKISFDSRELNTNSLNIEEELKITIETNKATEPKENLISASNVLIEHLKAIEEISEKDKEKVFEDLKQNENINEKTKTDIKTLELSVRSRNSLSNAGYVSLEEIAELTIKDLKNIKNLGEKSVEEILNKLKEKDINLSE